MAIDAQTEEKALIQLKPLHQPRYDFANLAADPEHIVFSTTEFDQDVTVPNKLVFPLGISFVDVTFRKKVDFEKVSSEGPIYFWNCRFEGEVTFFRMRVTCGCRPIDQRLPGEVNFSYCRFVAPPSFDRAQLFGPVFFHRTVFYAGVSLEEVRFEGGVRFEGSLSDICFSKREIQRHLCSSDLQGETSPARAEVLLRTDELIDQLKKTRILFTNTDHPDHYNFDWKLRSKDSVSSALAKSFSPGWMTESEVNRILSLWSNGFASTMFGGHPEAEEKPLTSFRGTQFGPKSSFNHVKLANCLFQGANISESEFVVVEWAKQPCGLLVRYLFNNFQNNVRWMTTWRAALQDELQLDLEDREVRSKEELKDRRKELSELYRALRMAYDRENDSQMGRDFYFGELEAERLSFGQVRRRWRLAYFYRAFSGYSKREGLALGWLLSLIFLIFPAVFLVYVNLPEFRTLDSLLKSQDKVFGLSKEEKLGEEVQVPHCWVPSVTDDIQPGLGGGSTPSLSQITTSPQVITHDEFTNALSRALDTVKGNGNPWSQLLRIETSSLQASTFLPTPNQASSVDAAIQVLGRVRCRPNYPFDKDLKGASDAIAGREFRRRVLEALERITVLAQLALFLVALKSKFQRKY